MVVRMMAPVALVMATLVAAAMGVATQEWAAMGAAAVDVAMKALVRSAVASAVLAMDHTRW